MKTKLPAGIGTIEQAKAFLNALHASGETFHPNDDATALIGDPFTQEEGESLNALMLDIFNLPGNEEPAMMSFDPSLYLMAIEEHESNLVKYRTYLLDNHLDDDSNGIDPVDLWIFMQSIDEGDIEG